MKTIKYIFTFILIIIFSVACDDFLQEDMKGQYTSNSFFSSSDNAVSAVTGVYNSLYGSTLWIFGDVASDDAVKGGNAGDQADINDIDDHSASADNGVLNTYWINTYETVSRANNVIAYAPDIKMDETLKARLIGEAKFLRAYAYFNLVNIYGEIPIKTEPQINTETIYVGLSSVANVYTLIDNDLQSAVSALPDMYVAEQGRVTKGAALALLAKSKLYQKKYSEALGYISDLEDIGIYELEENYEDLFVAGSEESTEVIFGLRYIDDEQVSLGNHLNVWFAPSLEGGYYFNAPTQDYVDAFDELTIDDEVDPRLDVSIGRDGQPWFNSTVFSSDWSEATGYLVKKYNEDMIPGKAKAQSVIPYHAIRYADILLMKAEALNETNSTTEAIIELNKVRERAMLAPVAALNQTSLREVIQHERRKELGFEFHRFFDQMRWDDQNRIYFPIPQTEIDTNHAIQ